MSISQRRVSGAAVWIAVSALSACGGGDGGGSLPPPPPTFTVGGTVAGLATGASMVLRFQQATDITVNANGSFTAPGSFANGTAYAIAVSTQPAVPSQTCAVTNASGTIAGASITNIAVACTTNTFSVGGVLAGLATGATVSLHNNGAGTLLLSANGPYSFDAVPSGTAYMISVFAQPSTPMQTCVVPNPGGAVLASNVTAVNVTCTTNTYTVSGTVNGLVPGSALALQNNGGDTAVIFNNGPFTFNSAIPSGAAYAVTVFNQPIGPSQTCSLTNAAGPIIAANVATLVVNCTVNRYSISGTVQGLSGGGLVISNNGGDDLSIGTNGGFTFPSTVPSGSNYNVTIRSQPSTGPRQRCAVSNASGGVGGANVSGISISCENIYVIRGTLSGLEGPEVRLRNGAEDLRVSSNGAFAFTTAFASGAAYNVTVQAAPILPEQVCTVTHGSGNIAAADIADVEVKCLTDRYVYAVDRNTDTIRGFRMHSLTGALRSATPDFLTGDEPRYMIADPHSRLVFVANSASNNISVYYANFTSGFLGEVPGSPFAAGTAPVSLAVDSEGLFLFAANAGSNNISVYQIQPNGGGGVLVPAPGSPFTAGAEPSALVASRAAQCCSLYVTNAGGDSVSAYAYDQDTGALTPHGPALSLPAGSEPGGISVNASAEFVLVTNAGTNTVSTFAITGGVGSLTEVAGSPVALGDAPCSIYTPPLSPHAFMTNSHADTVSVLGFDLNWLPQKVAPDGATGVAPCGVASDVNGKFLHVANAFSGTITGFTVDVSGVLTPVPGGPVFGGQGPSSIVILNNNQDQFDLGFR